MTVERLELWSELPPERCVNRLDLASGRLWRFMPWLHGVQSQPILFARRRRTVVLGSKNAVGRLRRVVALEIEPGEDGGSRVVLTPLYDPLLAISELMWFPALVCALFLPLYHWLFTFDTVQHFTLTMAAAFFALIAFVFAVGMRKPPPDAGPIQLDPEVVAFVKRELEAVPAR